MASISLLILLAAGAMLPLRVSENTKLPPGGIDLTGENGKGPITMIDEDNWRQVLSGEWLLLICSHYEPICKDLEKNFYQLATTTVGLLDVQLAFVDTSKPTSIRRRFSAFDDEIIYHVLDGEFRRLDDNQDIFALRDLLHLREWAEIQPEPFWKHPTSAWITANVLFIKAKLVLLLSGCIGNREWLASLIVAIFVGLALDFVLFDVYYIYRKTRSFLGANWRTINEHEERKKLILGIRFRGE